MNWKFWKKPPDQNGGKTAKTPRSAKPKTLPQAVGRTMVVSMQLDPDMVWGLKYLSQGMEGKKMDILSTLGSDMHLATHQADMGMKPPITRLLDILP